MISDKASYLYEVAFSFLYQDEKLVYELNDLISSQVRTFVYSKQQERLAGTDGVESFNKTFHDEARIVVILHRQNWGQTPWTKVEEIAIKNRAFKGDWDFFIVIGLDKSKLPSWIPLTNLYLDFQQFGLEKAAGAILYKVAHNGGEIQIESVENKAKRILANRQAKETRIQFMKSSESIVQANSEVELLGDKLMKYKDILERDGTLKLGTKVGQQPFYFFQINFRNYAICVNHKTLFDNYYIDASGRMEGLIRIAIFTFSGHHGFDYKETIIKLIDYKFDRDLSGRNCWSEINKPEKLYQTDELVELWIIRFIEGIEKIAIK